MDVMIVNGNGVSLPVNDEILARFDAQDEQIKEIRFIMADLVKVANEVKDAVNARLDREAQRAQAKLDAKQAELDNLKSAEDAEDVTQNAEIARLQAEVDAQQQVVDVLEGIKSGVNSDLNGDGGMVVPSPADETAPAVEAPATEAPAADPAVETAPVETAPVTEAPVETAPVETAPVVEPAPEAVQPVEAPVETAPVTEPAPVEQPVLVQPEAAQA